MARKTKSNSLDRWMQNVVFLETRLRRSHARSKCEVTMQEALCRLQERRAPPVTIANAPHVRKQRPLQLSPLLVKHPLPLESLTSAMHMTKTEALLLRPVPDADPVSNARSPLLGIPLKARGSSSSFLSSTGSSNVSSPLPGSLRSPLTLSARSKGSTFSSSCDQSSSSQRHLPADLFRIPLSKSPVHKNCSSPYLQRTLSPTKASQIPYLMPVSQIHPQPRPSNPSGSKSHRRRRRSRKREDCAASTEQALSQDSHSDACQVQAEQASPATPGLARVCAVRVTVPEVSSTQANPVRGVDHLQPGPVSLVIPVITIRTATPICIPGLLIPSITIRTATPMPGDTRDPPTVEEAFVVGETDRGTCTNTS